MGRYFGLFAFLFSVHISAFATPDVPAHNLAFPFVPTETMTVGSVCNEQDSDYQGHRYSEKIAYCQRNVKFETKAKIYEAYGISEGCRGQYTIDHFIPLSIGGTNHVDNLWPEAKSIKAVRQDLESQLFDQITRGEITQADAIKVVRDAKWNPPIEDPNSFQFCR